MQHYIRLFPVCAVLNGPVSDYTYSDWSGRLPLSVAVSTRKRQNSGKVGVWGLETAFPSFFPKLILHMSLGFKQVESKTDVLLLFCGEAVHRPPACEISSAEQQVWAISGPSRPLNPVCLTTLWPCCVPFLQPFSWSRHLWTPPYSFEWE